MNTKQNEHTKPNKSKHPTTFLYIPIKRKRNGEQTTTIYCRH